MRKYDSSLRWQLLKWIQELGSVDILVGIPCYNNEDTIAHVLSMVGRGLAEHFEGQRCAVLISDGGSLDDTREQAYSAKIPESIKRRVSIYRGVAGKGTAFRAVFEAAERLQARTVAVLDSDLRSITPEWVRLLATPVHDGKADFVAPLYRRFKYDGTITNNIVYPMTRALFGLRVRQPIGGDYSFTGRLASLFAAADVWDTDVARFGIDIWMTLMAICWNQRVAQVYLGTKIHSPKDPAADLSSMFCQVISTLFYVAGEMSGRVRETSASAPVDVVDTVGWTVPIEPVDVNVRAMDQEFLEGMQHFDPMYRQILREENYNALKEVRSASHLNGTTAFPASLWARILYDFLFVYQVWNRNRRRLVDMLVPLHFGRLASYCRAVADMDEEQVEELIEREAESFEQEKRYLLERWN
jgi:hypothetical protein